MVLYSDGVTEAQNDRGGIFRAAEIERSHSGRGGASCAEFHAAIQRAIVTFTAGADRVTT